MGVSMVWIWGAEEWWVVGLVISVPVPVWMWMAGSTSAGSRTAGAVFSGSSEQYVWAL